jgi:phosphate-selective porin OprO/OprP
MRASVDAAGFETSQGLQPIASDALLRTLRFYTTGDWSPTTSYALQLGVVDGNFYLHQASLRWRELPWVHNLSFGYLVVQQTLENVEPFGGNTFMEPGLPVLAFAPGNRMGVQSDRMLRGGRSSLTLGVYSVGADPGLNFGDQTQSLLRPTARFTTLPVFEEGGKGGRRLLHLGMSASATLAAESEVRYQARPESFIAPFLVDTSNIDSRGAVFAGGEAVYMQGPVTLQGEAMVNRAEGVDRTYLFGGAYLTAEWMLTGEERTYNRAVGIPERIIPNREFSAKAGTWGAWQVAARVSYLDLTSGPVEGGRILQTTLGLNWWWSRYLRWQLNYGLANVEGGTTPGRLQILQGRLQLMY